MVEDVADWDQLLAAVRPHLATLIDTQRDPWRRPVTSDRPHGDDDPSVLPEHGAALAEIMADLPRRLLDQGYCNGAHPRYFGYFHARPLPVAVLGDAISALLNQSPAAWRMGPTAAAVDIETLSWLAEFIGYPASAGGPAGIFTMGGTSANLVALKMARDRAFGPATIETGSPRDVRGVVYASNEIHYSVPRALDMLGLGRAALRTVATDGRGRILVDELRRAVSRDRRDGLKPIAAVGLAGATATGAVDDLAALADLCAREDMWFHVDGAAAAVFADLPSHRAAFEGFSRADSVALDPHKWMFVPYGLGCLLVRDPALLSAGFADGAHYWEPDRRADFVFLGPDGARPWRSLGLWLAIRQLGRRGYAELLGRNFAVARRLARRIEGADGLELLMEPVTPVCCFRARPNRPDVDIDRYNRDLHGRLSQEGGFYVTLCFPGGRTYLRAAINNYATRDEDVDALADAVARLHGTA